MIIIPEWVHSHAVLDGLDVRQPQALARPEKQLPYCCHYYYYYYYYLHYDYYYYYYY